MMKATSTIIFAISVLYTAPLVAGEPRTQRFDFANVTVGSLPDSFQTGMTGEWKATEWRVKKISGNQVMTHTGFWNEDPDGVYPLCWVRNTKARNLSLDVRLFPVRPPAEIPEAVHDGAGLVFRLRDANNYYLLRAVPHESRVRFYKVENGRRTTLAGRNLNIATGRWHDLGLRMRGTELTAYFDGAELFRHHDGTFRDAGAYGFWSKPNNVTYFDDLIAKLSD